MRTHEHAHAQADIAIWHYPIGIQLQIPMNRVLILVPEDSFSIEGNVAQNMVNTLSDQSELALKPSLRFSESDTQLRRWPLHTMAACDGF